MVSILRIFSKTCFFYLHGAKGLNDENCRREKTVASRRQISKRMLSAVVLHLLHANFVHELKLP